MKTTLTLLTTLLLAPMTGVCLGAQASQAALPSGKVPLIDVTDLYHTPQDPGDNFDIVTAYAMPELDLKAVVLDCTEPFRQPVAKNPGPGLFADANGPREPGFIPVLQLNYIYGRSVPCATIPFARMKSAEDKMLDAPLFQQQGIELILATLRASAEPVHIVSFGSARAIAVAYNREPALFQEKLACLHLCAGGSSPPAAAAWPLPTDKEQLEGLHWVEVPAMTGVPFSVAVWLNPAMDEMERAVRKRLQFAQTTAWDDADAQCVVSHSGNMHGAYNFTNKPLQLDTPTAEPCDEQDSPPSSDCNHVDGKSARR